MTRIAYGKRDNIQQAIADRTIPYNTLIITKDLDDPELFFYDVHGNLLPIAVRHRFDSEIEATDWVEKYPCPGQMITILIDGGWVPYMVMSDNTIEPLANIVEKDFTLQNKTVEPSAHEDVEVRADIEYYGLDTVNVIQIPYEEIDNPLGGKLVRIAR